MGSPRIVYNPRPDATPERQVKALARVYAYILKCHQEKKGGRTTAPEDATKGNQHDRADDPILPT